ncbi:hypothetical protein DICPUDRAFT_151118 [Dictyostelium purpureum]|uniref:CBS domain-containing protein n=1 Tax=Dictyostelium purpureum TaxID=5786 RepID=F0ZI13_DICPU|nr:uncharacterized protein DICPUDRAFT_151118 [Dictyostelium purpureum]EGC36431.1 hypothetical protein DICPUDRAFT_151118 [Dictyostelium purpureum]|eukprot:XP_003287064.1 hypothetical protein DICPUDRAFT_151118 [Dictyostelium purpureum]
MDSTVDFLKQTSIKEIIKPKEMVIVRSSSKYIDTMELMSEKHIYSAPVLNEDGRVSQVIDLLDMIHFIIEFLGLNIPENLKKLKNQPREFTDILTSSGNLFSTSTIQTVIGDRKIDKLVACRENTSLYDIILTFNDQISKVFVLDRKSEIINLISPTDILAMVAQNIHVLGTTRFRTIQNLGVAVPFKRTYIKDERVILILKDFIDNNFNAAPIVDDDNKLIANFSISNIKNLNQNFDDLMLPVKDFLEYQNIREKKKYITGLHESSLHPLTVSTNDTLENTIFKIVATKVHRLWVVNDQNTPIAMVTIDSILKIITLKSMDIDS